MEGDPQDSLVTSSEDFLQPNIAPTSGLHLSLYQSKNVRKKKVKDPHDQFPWLHSFLKLCRSGLGSTSIKVLLNLITVYTEHVSIDVTTSYTKPNRAAKLKKNMIDVISFFHNYYMNIKVPLDETVYMEKMSNLLTMYMDMEIKASRRGKESVKRITSKLISSLFIILNNSSEYIIDTILKSRFTVKSYSEICIPIFKRVTNLQVTQDMTYVRCLLIFKLWKRLVPKGEERNSINRLAATKLSPPPPQLLEMVRRGMLSNVLPPLTPNKKPALITRFYMVSKFNLPEAIKAFLRITTELKLNELTTALDTSRFFDEPSEQEPLLLSEGNKDDSFMDYIWKNISDPSPTISDSPSLDVILNSSLCETPKYKKNLNSNKSLNKTKIVKKSKVQKKNKKKYQEKKKMPKGGSSTKKPDYFYGLPLDILKKLKLCGDKTEGEELCSKTPTFSTIKNDFPSNEDSEAIVCTQKLSMPDSNETLINDHVTRKMNNTIEENENQNVSYGNIINISSQECNPNEELEGNSQIISNSHQLITLEDTTQVNSIESKNKCLLDDVLISSVKQENCKIISKAVKNEPKLENDSNGSSSDCIDSDKCLNFKYDDINNDNNKRSGKSQDTFKIINGLKIPTELNCVQKIEGCKSSKDENFLSTVHESPKIHSNESLTCEIKQNSFNIVENNSNTSALTGTLNSELKICSYSKHTDTSAKGNSETIFQDNSNINHLSTRLCEFQKIGNESNTPECVPKSESLKTDCMFQISNLKIPTDSINNVQKFQQINIKNEQETKECYVENCEKYDQVLNENSVALCLKDSQKCINSSEKDFFQNFKLPKNTVNSKKVNDFDFQDCSNTNKWPDNSCEGGQSDNNCKHIQVSTNDLNACLLHKILGEDDCLKNPSPKCISKNSETQEFGTISEEQCFADQESSDSRIYIKKEEEYENQKQYYDCNQIESSKRETSLSNKSVGNNIVEVFPLDHKLHLLNYQTHNETDDQFTDNYDYESEDSNLVIDEDIDIVRDQNEDEIEQSNFPVEVDDAPHVIIDNMNLSNLSRVISKESKDKNTNLFGRGYQYKNADSSRNQFLEKEIFTDNIIMNHNPSAMPGGNMSIDNSSFATSCVKENLTASKSFCSSNNMFTSDESKSQVNTMLYRKEDSGFKDCIGANTLSLPKLIRIPNFKAQNLNQGRNSKVVSGKLFLRGNDSKFPPEKQPEDSILVKNGNPLIISKIKESDFKSGQIKQVAGDNFISVNQSLVPTKKLSTTPLTSDDCNNFGNCSQFNTDRKIFVLANKKNLVPFEHVHQDKNAINTHYQVFNKKLELCENLNSSIPKLQENSAKYVSDERCTGANYLHEEHTRYIDKKSNHNQTFSKTCELIKSHTKLKSDELLFNKTHIAADPLCLVVKNKEEHRESICDFEFNIFPVAHEVEVCSATDSGGGDWISSGSSEIGHPDWPIANEQSVIDSSTSSVPYSSTSDQYGSSIKTDQCFINNENPIKSSQNSLELQQVSVDFSCAKNIENNFNKDKFNLHLRTLEVDYNMCCSQGKFKEFYLSEDIPPTIPVPFPLRGRNDGLKSSVRCLCEQCSDNHQILLSNYNVLTHFRNSKVKPLNSYAMTNTSSFCDKEQGCELDCSLPLKKRKTLTNSKSVEEPKLMSYPNTPMISIAQLELASFEQQNQVIVSNPQNHWNTQSDCVAKSHNPINLTQCTLEQENSHTKHSKRKASKRKKCAR